MGNASVVGVPDAGRSAQLGWQGAPQSWRRSPGVKAEQRVLLVDESRLSCAALDRIAGRADAVVDHAHTFAAALQLVSRTSYDAVVVDSIIGSDCQLHLLEQLRVVQSTAGVLLSGERLALPAHLSHSDNLLGSLKKPWNDEELEAALRRCFELSRARRAQRPKELPARVHFESVLLIGSSVDMRRIGRMLHGRVPPGGFVHAPSLEEGLSLLAQQAFDLVLTDLCLPDACGLDAVVKIRHSHSPVPIVVLTAREDMVLSEQVLNAGAQDVLDKPGLDAGTLLRSMRHAHQRHRAQAHLQHDVLHDELTSLAKRALLNQRIGNALARSRRMGNTFAVIYIDLDHFKRINDTHGHDVGDAVLVAVSQRLKAAVREYDTVARLGGDEFAILLDTLDGPAEAEIVAQRVLSSLAPPVRVTDGDLEITASMGISVFPQGGTGADDLLRSADQAMYCAKRAGRNTYSLTPLPDASALLLSDSGAPTDVRGHARSHPPRT